MRSMVCWYPVLNQYPCKPGSWQMQEKLTEKNAGIPKPLIIKLVVAKVLIIGVVVAAVFYML